MSDTIIGFGEGFENPNKFISGDISSGSDLTQSSAGLSKRGSVTIGEKTGTRSQQMKDKEAQFRAAIGKKREPRSANTSGDKEGINKKGMQNNARSALSGAVVSGELEPLYEDPTPTIKNLLKQPNGALKV